MQTPRSTPSGRNTIFEKDPTQSRVVAVERGFHPSLQLAWDTNARVLRDHFEVHAIFVLRSELVRTKIDETRFRAANKQRLEIMVIVVSDVRVNVVALKLGLPHQHPQRFFRSAARGSRPVPRNWVTGGGVGGTEADGAPAVVAAAVDVVVVVVAAVVAVVYADVVVEPACNSCL